MCARTNSPSPSGVRQEQPRLVVDAWRFARVVGLRLGQVSDRNLAVRQHISLSHHPSATASNFQRYQDWLCQSVVGSSYCCNHCRAAMTSGGPSTSPYEHDNDLIDPDDGKIANFQAGLLRCSD